MKFQECSNHLDNDSEPWEAPWHDILWFDAQSAHAVEAMEKHLARRLPDPGAIVISHIGREYSVDDVPVLAERTNATMVRCSCGEKEWFLKLQGGQIVLFDKVEKESV